MGFFARIFRFLFWVLILSWAVALLRRLVGSMAPPAEDHSPSESVSDERQITARKLVRDPICGMHVAEVVAIPLREGEQTLHFCSTACRDAYVQENRKLAANG